jgi:hypothetical protein
MNTYSCKGHLKRRFNGMPESLTSRLFRGTNADTRMQEADSGSEVDKMTDAQTIGSRLRYKAEARNHGITPLSATGQVLTESDSDNFPTLTEAQQDQQNTTPQPAQRRRFRPARPTKSPLFPA